MHRTLAAALTAAALLWGATILAAPFAVKHPTFAAPSAVLYAAASRFCHQRPERSFHLDGVQMPVCARCAAIYLSAAIGVLFGWMGLRPGNTRLILLAAALPTAITWALEHLAGIPFTNSTRGLAALPLGAAAGWVFIGLLRYDSRLHGDKNPGR